MSLVSRDPFAREELHRERDYGPATCDWCGQQRRTPSGRPYLFAFRIETDGGRTSALRGRFCSVSCLRTYNGQGV